MPWNRAKASLLFGGMCAIVRFYELLSFAASDIRTALLELWFRSVHFPWVPQLCTGNSFQKLLSGGEEDVGNDFDTTICQIPERGLTFRG